MTIGESIIQWLYGFGDIEIDQRITTDQLGAEEGALALFKEPTKSEVVFLDGSHDVTERYYFLIRQPSQTNSERISNAAWLERLERWVRDQNLKKDYPHLEAGLTCFAIAVAVSAYVMEQKEEESIYQISVAISYSERSM